MFLGGEDLSADLRCKRTKGGEEIRYARGRMVMAARAAGVEVYDTPFTDVNDDEGALRRRTSSPKSLGFSGKSCDLARATCTARQRGVQPHEGRRRLCLRVSWRPSSIGKEPGQAARFPCTER